MTALWFVGATLVLIAAGYLYHHSHFWIAAVLGLTFVGTMLWLSFPVTNPTLWTLFTVVVVIGPMILLAWHTIDQRLGLFLLPTVYSIPLAMICAAFLWLSCGISLLWSAFS
ncbi:MAG: hypothetical protein V3T86_11195 [Planctomycetota bacterium]